MGYTVENAKAADISNIEALYHLQQLHKRKMQDPQYRAAGTFHTASTSGQTPADPSIQIMAANARHRQHSRLVRLHGVVGDVRRSLEEDGAALDGFGTAAEFEEEEVMKVGELVKRLKPFGLTKGEILCLCNLRPRSVVEIEAVVEEAEQRFGEGRAEEILSVCGDVLGFRSNDFIMRNEGG